MKSSSKSPTVADLKRTLSKMGVVHKSTDSKAVLKGRLTKAKNAKKSPKKSPKKRSKRASPKKRSAAKRGPKVPCKEGYSRNEASRGRCAKDGSNKLRTVAEIKKELKEKYMAKYGRAPKLVGKSKSQAISMLARLRKCPESGKVWDSVAKECKSAKLRGEIGSKAIKKLQKLAEKADRDLVKHKAEIEKIKIRIAFSKQKAAIAKEEKKTLADLDAGAELAEKALLEGLNEELAAQMKQEQEYDDYTTDEDF